MKRCFVYTRVSTAIQAEEGYSLGEQEDRLTKYADAMGWELMKVYSDGGYSGGNMERPSLQQMITDIKAGKTDIVLVDKLDRLSRSQFDILYLIKKIFIPNNVAFVSRAESFDTSTPFGRAMIGILAVFAELERERIKERMNEGKVGRIKEGLHHGGNTVSYGYDYDRDKGYLVINPYEAMITREIFKRMCDREPIGDIVRDLNDRGIKTKMGAEWSKTTLRQMAQNKTYIGMQCYRGEWVESLNERILTDEEYARLEELMEERSIKNEKHLKGRKYSAPLAGLIYCAKCGAKYQHKTRPDGTKVYVCYSRSKTTKSLIKDPNCRNTIYKASDLEDAVYRQVEAFAYDDYLTQLQDSTNNSDNIKAITSRIKSVESQMSKLLDLYALGSMDMNILKSKVDTLNAEKISLDAELQKLTDEKPKANKADILRCIDLFKQARKDGNTADIHNSIVEVLNYIEINDDEVKLFWKL